MTYALISLGMIVALVALASVLACRLFGLVDDHEDEEPWDGGAP